MKIQRDDKRIPDFLVVGAQRCGTTWLHENLSLHPEVFLPGQKELNFFSDIESNWEKGIDWYRENFHEARGVKAIGEITPEYLVDPVAPQRILSSLGKIKIICILRDPVERAFSSYKKGLRELNWQCGFSEFIRNDMDLSVSRGLYSQQVERYVTLFGKKNVLILSYNQIDSDPKNFLRLVYEFIGVNEDYISPLIENSFNIGSSSSPVIKSTIFIRNVIYRFPYGRSLIKQIQRTSFGNHLMTKLLKGQVVKNEGGNSLAEYRKIFERDLREVKSKYGIDFLYG